MHKLSTDLKSYEQTISLINYTAPIWVKKGDLDGCKSLSYKEFYTYIKSLPYIPDPKHAERLSRPAFTIDPDYDNSRDCDDKTLALATFCVMADIPYRIVVMGRGLDPHHVTLQVKDRGTWIYTDATYPEKGSWGKPLFHPKFLKYYSEDFTKHMPKEFIPYFE